MIKTILTILLSTVQSAGSPGCGKDVPYPPGENHLREIYITDPATGEAFNRKYVVNLPANYDNTKEYDVIMWFHWWGDPLIYKPYIDIGQRDGVISVYPHGEKDYSTGSGWSSWNIGPTTQHDDSCTEDTYGYCYRSCEKLDKCSRCSCFTCYDDIHFVKELIKELQNELCVDPAKLHVSGNSNGGMFVYYLTSQIPELIASYALIAGQPLIGGLNTGRAAKNSYIISLHGRSDDTLPAIGGIDGSNEWMYESLNNTFYVFGLIQGCDISSWERVATPFDNDTSRQGNLACSEYTRGCGGRVMQCMHDGNHDIIPHYMPELTWWFWNTRNENQPKLDFIN